MLRTCGHKVSVSLEWDGKPVDVLFALHARRSHPSILRYHHAHPEGKLVVVLTGTDLYRDIRFDAGAQQSIELAKRLVVLQEQGLKELARRHRAKTSVVYQSARVPERMASSGKIFRVCVVGHLREEKDPFRPALALRLIPPADAIELIHVGNALSPDMAAQAKSLADAEPRYRWLGGLPHWRALRWLCRSQLMVISSRMEGGANVIAEAVRAGVPVLASDIPGNVGMLGADYPGYYRVGDERALAGFLIKAMRHQAFYQSLKRGLAARSHLFRPQSEQSSLARLLRELA